MIISHWTNNEMGYGIVIGIVIGVIIISAILLSMGLYYKKKRDDCQSAESPYCMTITCPDDPTSSTCGGYAKRPAEKEGHVYCSSAPNSMVEDRSS